jgi:uncharacterized phage infection (PIP) family protein YhgE
MKNEDRIIELLIETLQKVDEHQETLEKQQNILERHDERIQELYTLARERQDNLNRMMDLLEKHNDELMEQGKVLGLHNRAFVEMEKRIESGHQNDLAVQELTQQMLKLVLLHNKTLQEKGILV